MTMPANVDDSSLHVDSVGCLCRASENYKFIKHMRLAVTNN